MTKFLYLSTLFLYISVNLFSQNFKGSVTDTKGNAVYGATIFIKELNQGLICDENGHFQATIPQGNYTVEFRCLGYIGLERKIAVENTKTVSEHIILKERPFDLNEVVISNKEDPAYEIMRNSIKKAPYHAQLIKGYTAEAYIKGTMELKKVSSIINSLTSTEGLKMSDYKGKLFVQESFSEVTFRSPDKYTQTVKAFSSTIPDNFDSKDVMGVMNSSLYLPTFAGRVSPLNPKAFDYYKFRYEGFTEEENGDIINKIKVIPKLKDPELMSGYIYIADNTWDIRNIDLIADRYGIKENFIISYNQVSDGIHLPTTYNTLITANMLGIEGFYNYYSSLKYTSIDINSALDVTKKISEKKKRTYEIKPDSLYSIKSDTLALHRDSMYWEKVRNIPLSKDELVSYVKKDSVQSRIDSLRKAYHNSKFRPIDLILGGKIGGDSAKVTFKYDGLLFVIPEYNFVDGAWIGQTFWLEKKIGKYNRVKFIPSLYYATARKRLITNNQLSLEYAPMRLGMLSLSGGSTSSDYNVDGLSRFDNAISSFFLGKNVAMLYQKDYINMKNEVDLSNGLKISTGLDIAFRKGLHNNTKYSLFGSDSKTIDNLYFADNFDLTSYSIGLEYSPRAYYTITKGQKKYQSITSPTFVLTYTEGFSSWQENNSQFRKIESTISQVIRLSPFSILGYRVDAGTFIGDNSRTHFTDYKHFNTSNMFSISKPPTGTFMLLDNYEASTNKNWFVTQVNYKSKYIALKYLPFLQGKLFNESLHLKHLYTPTKKYYSELGYSIDLLNMVSFGVFTSFDKLKAERVGFRLSYNLQKILHDMRQTNN